MPEYNVKTELADDTNSVEHAPSSSLTVSLMPRSAHQSITTDVEASSDASSLPSPTLSTPARSPSPPKSFVFKSSKYTPSTIPITPNRSTHRPTLSIDLLSRHAGQAVDIGSKLYHIASSSGSRDSLLENSTIEFRPLVVSSIGSRSADSSVLPSPVPSAPVSPLSVKSASSPVPSHGKSPMYSPSSPSVSSASNISITSSPTLASSPSGSSRTAIPSTPSSTLHARRRQSLQAHQYTLSLSEIMEAAHSGLTSPLAATTSRSSPRAPRVSPASSTKKLYSPGQHQEGMSVLRAADGTKKLSDDDEEDYFHPKSHVPPPTDALHKAVALAKSTKTKSKSKSKRSKTLPVTLKKEFGVDLMDVPFATKAAPLDKLITSKAYISPPSVLDPFHVQPTKALAIATRSPPPVGPTPSPQHVPQPIPKG